MTNILYSFRRCPYAMRARMALKYSGIKVAIHEVSLKDKPKALLELSPKGQVPVLVIHNKVIDESMKIMFLSLLVNDPDGWIHEDEKIMQQAEDLITMNDHSFKEHLDHYKYFNKEQTQRLEECRAKGEEFLKILEEKLSQNRYLFGDKMLCCDIAIFPFIRQFAHVDTEWFYQSPYKYVQKWLDHFLESTLFNDIMIKDLKAL